MANLATRIGMLGFKKGQIIGAIGLWHLIEDNIKEFMGCFIQTNANFMNHDIPVCIMEIGI